MIRQKKSPDAAEANAGAPSPSSPDFRGKTHATEQISIAEAVALARGGVLLRTYRDGRTSCRIECPVKAPGAKPHYCRITDTRRPKGADPHDLSWPLEVDCPKCSDVHEVLRELWPLGAIKRDLWARWHYAAELADRRAYLLHVDPDGAEHRLNAMQARDPKFLGRTLVVRILMRDVSPDGACVEEVTTSNYTGSSTITSIRPRGAGWGAYDTSSDNWTVWRRIISRRRVVS